METKTRIRDFYSKEWANEQLRFAILVLKGQCGGHRWKGNLQIALYVKEGLLEHGYTWQSKIIEFWIHRLQPRKADSPQKGGGESLHSRGILPYAKSTVSKSENLSPQFGIIDGVKDHDKGCFVENLPEREKGLSDLECTHEKAHEDLQGETTVLGASGRFPLSENILVSSSKAICVTQTCKSQVPSPQFGVIDGVKDHVKVEVSPP